MNTVFETRRLRLGMLIAKHGKIADLNRALGWEETNGRLYQIHNRSIRSDRGTPYELGDPTAREIEATLKLETGWMDTPPTYAEIHGEDDPRSKAHILMDSIADDQVHMVLRLITAVAQPGPKVNNGR